MATPAERFRLLPITVDAASVPVEAEDDRRGHGSHRYRDHVAWAALSRLLLAASEPWDV